MIILTLLIVAVAAVAAPAQEFGMSEGLNAAVMNSRSLGARAPLTLATFRASAAVAAINTGFLALGDAGQTGRVKGPDPFGIGNGTYEVIQNDPYQMVFDMKTGFVVGRFTLTRDPQTGRDQMSFEGQTKDMTHPWTPQSGTFAGRVTYDARTDSGRISWQLNGKQQNDVYENGGATSMTITLAGNQHTFTQDAD